MGEAQNQIQRAPQRPEPTLKDLVASTLIQQKLAKVAGKHFDHDRLAQAMLIMVNKNQDLQQCTPTSLLDCLMVAAQQGWTIGGPRPGMYIVKYDNIATPIPSYYGFQETARDSEQEWEIEAAVVRDGDEFRYCRGLMPVLEHRPHDDEEANITHAYAIARSKGGRVKFEVMNIDAIEAVRARSRAKAKGPWVTDYAEMCKKTVVRRLCKYLPSSPKMDMTLELSDRGDDVEVIAREVPQRMNLRQQANPTNGASVPPVAPSLPLGAAAPTNAPGSLNQRGDGPAAADKAGSGKVEHAHAGIGEPPAPAQTTPGEGAPLAAPSPKGGRPKPKKTECLTCGAQVADGHCTIDASHDITGKMPKQDGADGGVSPRSGTANPDTTSAPSSRSHEPSQGVKDAEAFNREAALAWLRDQMDSRPDLVQQEKGKLGIGLSTKASDEKLAALVEGVKFALEESANKGAAQ